jgi:cytochrome c peroxidase
VSHPAPEGIPGEGEILAGKYLLSGVLGQGGMGVVVAAQHVELRQRVAVKFLLPAATRLPQHKERFLREARAAASLRSVHVARVLDVDSLPSGALYMVMEHLEGVDLRALLVREGKLPPAEAVDHVLQACEAMAEAHALGIVHRDLKPSNLFLASPPGAAPLIKVLDFGLSKALVPGEEGGDASITATGVVMGSFLYMAPEQLRGLRLADARADIWSLGVILYELMTGARPFEGSVLTEVAIKVVEETPPSLRDRGANVSPALESAVLRCLEKKREHRYQTVADLARALAPFAGEVGREAADRIARAREGSGSGPRSRAAAPDPGITTAAMESERSVEMTAPVASATLVQAPPPGRPRRAAVAAVGVAVALASALLTARFLVARRASGVIDAERLASFAPLVPPPPPADRLAEERIALGRTLFSDARLSKNANVSCATCHPLDAWGADGKRLSRGSDDREPPRNTLGIYNVGGFFTLLWDGRKDDLATQAREVLLSPRAMAATEEKLVETLRGIPSYGQAFARAFPGEGPPVSFDNVAKALAAYEATLVTRGRWDRFLEGDKGALTDQEKAGFNRFVDVGCIACHFGPNVGATMFQKVGLVKAWPNTKDRGRYEITKRDADWMVFRVPSLRNVAKTAPYFHDGSIASLSEAIRLMAHHQIGRDLDDEDVTLIAAWLESLTGDLPPDVGAKGGR